MGITRNVQGRKTEEVLEIPIRAGFKKGTKVTFPGKGDEPAPGVAGDVVFVVDEKPHATFKREGNDLLMVQTVPLVRALTEFAKTAPDKIFLSTRAENADRFLPLPLPRGGSRARRARRWDGCRVPRSN